MDNNEKVKIWLRELLKENQTACPGGNCDNCPYYDEEECFEELQEDAIIFLQDEPVKVRNMDGVFCCGACGHPVFPALMERYCPGCGKKVDYCED